MLLFSSEHTTPILWPLKYVNGDGFKCNNKETEEKGQLVYTIKLLFCIKSGVILRKFQWCIVFAYG